MKEQVPCVCVCACVRACVCVFLKIVNAVLSTLCVSYLQESQKSNVFRFLKLLFEYVENARLRRCTYFWEKDINPHIDEKLGVIRISH